MENKILAIIILFLCIITKSHAQSATDSMDIAPINDEYKIGEKIQINYKNDSCKQLFVKVTLECMRDDGTWYCLLDDIFKTYKQEKSLIDNSMEILPVYKGEMPSNSINGIKDSRTDIWQIYDFLYERGQKKKYRLKYSISLDSLYFTPIQSQKTLPITIKYSIPFNIEYR
jgi:hypothetical protein